MRLGLALSAGLIALAATLAAARWASRRRRLGKSAAGRPAPATVGPHLPGERSRRRAAPPVKLACAASAFEYATAVEHTARRGDKVLVLGGLPEAALHALAARTRGAGGRIVHVDMQRKGSALQCEVAHVETVCGDVRDVSFLLGLGVHFDMAFIDINLISGNDLVLDQVAFIGALCSLFGTSFRQIVIKSRALTMLASHWVDASKFVHAVQSGLALQENALCASAPAQKNENGAAAEDAPAPVEALPLAAEALALAPDWARASGVALPTIYIGAHGVAEYRAAAVAALLPTDSVLEIGCHTGATTRLLHKHLRSMGGSGVVVGVDIGKSIIQLARKFGPADIRYEVVDGWNTTGLQKLSSSFTVVMVDVGGVSSHHGLLEAISLLRQLRCAFAPHVRLIVAKSKCVRDFGIYAHPASRLWRGEKDTSRWRRLAEEAVAHTRSASVSVLEGGEPAVSEAEAA